MKKLFALLMALVFACTFLTALCETAAPLRIVCTTFPQYDWTRQLLGDRADDVELTLLLDNGIDLHNYQPTADDIIKIARSDLFIYVGGESDAWVNDLLETSQNSRVKALSMLACVDAKEEEAVEGMQEEAHECGHAHHEAEYDEHVWLSLRNAQTITRAILEALCEAETYRANADAYIAQLAELDAQYADMVRHAARTAILFADRFPFRYLADDYGLTYYAAFAGCSAETEASFKTIAFLAKKVDELNLPAVLAIEGGNHAIAETVVASTQAKNQVILSMNSLQSMTENLAILTQALN